MEADTTPLAISTQGLTKRYGPTVALDGLDLQVGEAEVFGLLGPNGAGKTTAVKILLGLTHADGGSGRLELRDIIRSLAADGTTVLLNSHQLSEVEQVCHRVAIIHRGRLQASGTLDELLSPGGVRIRATQLSDEVRAELDRFGRVMANGAWLEIAGAVEDASPEIVE